MEQVVDIRLKPGGQLSGFAKQDDLAWFLERLNGAGYVHLRSWRRLPRFAMTIAKTMTGNGMSALRGVDGRPGYPDILDRDLFAERVSCLLCSEPTRSAAIAVSSPNAWPGPGRLRLSTSREGDG